MLKTAGVTGTKVCNICREDLPLDRFGPNKKSVDGHAYRCRACNRIRAKAARAERAEYWLLHDPYAEHESGVKTCRDCKTEFPVTKFSRDNVATDGLQRHCKKCQIDRWRKEKYGRSLEEHGDACDICGYSRNLCIDHCHRTGITRGNLCRECNMALGLFLDDANRLAKAIGYLENWASPTTLHTQGQSHLQSKQGR